MKSIRLKLLLVLCLVSVAEVWSQALRIPDTVNISNQVGRELGVTQIEVQYNSPAVRGREGQIWGTNVVPFDFMVLGFGSNAPSPWRAGADESTTISFSTDVKINGEELPAGKYGFFIAVYPDSCLLIFNKNIDGWGSYFYNKDLDILRVATKQQKNLETTKERLEYNFYNQTEDAVELALEWEHWSIPFTISVDLKKTILRNIQRQLSGAIGFDPASLQAGAQWCLTNEVNYSQALDWINSATSPSLGGLNTFNALSIKAGLLEKIGQSKEAEQIRVQALDNATVLELHQYGRQLLAENKQEEAFVIFEKNFKKFKGAWPTNVGMMRILSAQKNFSKALQFAKKALPQAPDDLNKNALEAMIKKLEGGKDIN